MGGRGKDSGIIHDNSDKTIILDAKNKSEALKDVNNIPSAIQPKIKAFFQGGSNKYSNFSVKKLENGNYIASMTKPGNVPGSKAIYYKEINAIGNTISVYKKTFDPAGNLVHIKDK